MHSLLYGGSPKLWLEVFIREKGLAWNDCIVHELRVLIDALEVAVYYDQINAGAITSMEILARRVQAILDAYGQPGKAPNWSMATYFTGQKSAADGVSAALRHFVAKQAKGERDIHVDMARGSRVALERAQSVDRGVTNEQPRAAWGGGKAGRARGRGRGLAPAVPP